jgi:hypothetical protein
MKRMVPIRPGRSVSDNKPEVAADTFQDGAAPVQAFSSPTIPVSSGPPPEVRRGRPPRIPAGQRQDTENYVEPEASDVVPDDRVGG